MSGADKRVRSFWRDVRKLLKYGRTLTLAPELAALKVFKVKLGFLKQLQLQCDFWATSREHDTLNVTTSGRHRSVPKYDTYKQTKNDTYMCSFKKDDDRRDWLFFISATKAYPDQKYDEYM